MNIELLDSAIRRVPDFPKPGILFYDITSILTDAAAFKSVLEEMYAIYKDKDIDAIAAVESRGFIFGMPMAYKLNAGFIPIRKPNRAAKAIPTAKASTNLTPEGSEFSVTLEKNALVKAPIHIKPQCPILSSPSMPTQRLSATAITA